MPSNYKVIHLPTTVGGNPQGLSRALQRVGVNSISMSLEQNYFQYPTDIVLWSTTDSLVYKEFKRVVFFFRILKNYHVIHYNSGTTLMRPVCPLGHNERFFVRLLRLMYSIYTNFFQLLELKILKFLGKKIFVTYQGDDARQGDYSLKNFKISIAQRVDERYYNKISDHYKRFQIKRMAKYANKVFCVNPDLLHVLPNGSCFMPYSHIFFEEWLPVFNQLENRPLRFVHAPSNRRVKGTDLITEALNQLRDEGYVFEFLLVEGMSHLEAKKCYEQADVLIDQLFAGWYGGLAVEAMALGKPVVVYIREEDLSLIPNEMRADLPFIRTTPDTVKETLKSILKMSRETLSLTAQKSRLYIEKWHNPLSIAHEYKKEYDKALGL